ncbi:hypothetical protein CKO25_05875 [Thiocapsa imhoffii]|uniref:Anti sigma-E protein RseA N-terminal domain-containing protein n=1 Tax=Thiocapsa imhoffii TaxID=382777 RepID=A0A9X0WGA8_9GAMM|nr:sigma-E factor negative regulatory protein [Thiocapsa imhoffii]MBK1644189.1 hypothetical protein [Thiocapsa imhoffii]
MSDGLRQHLSEFQDGELNSADATRVVDALEQRQEWRAAWERYHLIGLAIRGEPVVDAHREIAVRVRERVRDEPTQLAPGASRTLRALNPGQRVPVRPVAGIALAAAAAVFAVFVVPTLFSSSSTLPPVANPTASLTAQHLIGMPPHQRWDLDRPELSDKLDFFLVNHQEAAPSTGAKGLLPYANFVGYEVRR